MGNSWQRMEVVAEREQSVIGEGEPRTNGDKSPLSRRTASKEEPIPSGGESDEERKPVTIVLRRHVSPLMHSRHGKTIVCQ